MGKSLPPIDAETKKVLFKFLRHTNRLIKETATSSDEKKRMNLLMFNLLASIDGFYNHFPTLKLTTVKTNIEISSYLHHYFTVFMDGEML